MNKQVFITECPRDAMQGLKDFIPTEKKMEYMIKGYEFSESATGARTRTSPEKESS